jgi:hypothetical protein
MRRVLALILLAITGAACSATVKWEKAGASAAERQRDETDCTSQASRQSSVPTAQNIGVTPGTPVDPQATRIRSFDTTVFEECMRTRGYERVAPTPK